MTHEEIVFDCARFAWYRNMEIQHAADLRRSEAYNAMA